MKTKRSIILILVLLMLLSVALTGCQSFQGDFTPLTAAQKAEIEDAFMKVAHKELCWWDENGYDRIPTVFRYFDTYGDCIVLLRYIPTPSDWLGNPIDPPYMLDYLTRPVECPTAVSPTGHKVIFSIWLYNTDPSWRKVFNDADYPHNLDAPLTTMEDLHNRGLIWLTHEELEQLTTDLENWIAEGNY